MIDASHDDSAYPPATSSDGMNPEQAAATPIWQSPSLTSPGNGPRAFEMKMLISAEKAALMQDWARRHLALDPYAHPARNDGYETTTLYFDTPQFDVFHRSAGFHRRKYRLRRYNGTNTLFAECKTRKGDVVSKERCVIPLAQFSRFMLPVNGLPVNGGWPGAEYHQALYSRSLRPTCRMTYDRSAYFAVDHTGPIRLTFDRNLRGVLCDNWIAAPLVAGTSILRDEVICEFKFRDTLPFLFKKLVEEFQLEPAAVSKYRRMMTALGGVPEQGATHV